MRRVVAVSLLVVALLLIPAASADAGSHGGHGGRGHGYHGFHGHFHGDGGIVVEPSFWWDPWWWYYPYPPYYYPPPLVVQPGPVVGEGQPPQGYWYYCASAKAYFPTVPTCPEVWIKVPARAQ